MKIYYRGKCNEPLVSMVVMPARLLLVVAILILSGTGPCRAASDKLELTRQDAIAMAVRKNVDLKAAILNPAMAKATLAGSRGIYDPLVSATANTDESTFPGGDFKTKSTTASLGVTQLVPTGASIAASTQSGFSSLESHSARLFTRSWQSVAGVTISQPLLKNFGRETTELNISLAANAYQGSLEQYRFYITDTVLLVITSYNHLYILRQIQQQRESALASAVKFLDEIQKTAKQRVIGKMETANAEYAIYQRRKDLVDASRTVQDQEATLRFLIGMEDKTQIIPIDKPSEEEPAENEKQAVKTALEVRSDLRQLQLTLQASELQERVAKHQLLPDLSLNVSGNLGGLESGFEDTYDQIGGGDYPSWAAGVVLSVPIGNTTAKNDYLVKKIRTEQAKHQIASFAWQIQNAVEADMRALISARLQIQLANKSVEIGQLRLAEYRKNLKEGRATVQNVIDTENDLILAQIGQVEANETFASTVALLWRDMGVLLDHNNIHVDSSTSKTIPGETSPAATPKGEG
jgi:outer membrane protein